MAMKTIRSNWRVEIRLTPAVEHLLDNKVCETVHKGLAQMIGDQCPGISNRCIVVAYNEELICDNCGSKWITHTKTGMPLLKCVVCGASLREGKTS